MILRKEYRFEAAHFIHNHPGKCRNMHGHSYRLFVSLAGKADPETGMIMDFEALSAIVRERVLQKLDHRFLNDLIPLPTSEHIACWIWEQLKPQLDGLDQIELFETAENCVVYRGEA